MTLVSSRPFATVHGFSTWTRSSLLFRLFPSSLGQAPNKHRKTTRREQYGGLSQQYRPRAFYYPYLLKLKLHSWGRGSYFLLATFVRNDNHSSRWAIRSEVGMRDQQTCTCPQKADSCLSGCGWNAGWQMYPIRKFLYGGGLCHRQVLSGYH